MELVAPSPPRVTAKNVSRHCYMSFRGMHPQERPGGGGEGDDLLILYLSDENAQAWGGDVLGLRAQSRKLRP